MSRLDTVRKSIQKNGLDALFVSDQNNVAYLTGCRGLSPNERESFLFISAASTHLLTFPTYFDLFNKKNSGYVTLNITPEKRLRDHLNERIADEHISTIGFEQENLTVIEHTQLKERVPAKWQTTTGIVESFRRIKEIPETDAIRHAAAVTDEVFDYLLAHIREGMTEKEIAVELEYHMKKRADDVAFSPIVAFNEHAAIPHYLPTNDQKLTTGHLILLDFGAKANGYCSDMTRVIFFGKPKEEYRQVYDTVCEAQKRALDYLHTQCRDAKYCVSPMIGSETDRITREFITSRGYPQYQHGLGHGVGLAIHEAPRLRQTGTDELQPGMVITVEPGIYLPGICGVRIEDLVLLTQNGIDVLSKASKEMIVL